MHRRSHEGLENDGETFVVGQERDIGGDSQVEGVDNEGDDDEDGENSEEDQRRSQPKKTSKQDGTPQKVDGDSEDELEEPSSRRSASCHRR